MMRGGRLFTWGFIKFIVLSIYKYYPLALSSLPHRGGDADTPAEGA